MNFINPITILAFANTPIVEITNEAIKKSKKRLFAEIELSDDGLYEYYNFKLTRSAIEPVIDQLEDIEKLEFYHFIANSTLNQFLVSGDTSFFTNFRQEGIFRLPSFIKFISAHYAPVYGKFLMAAFMGSDFDLFRKGIQVPELFTVADRTVAYRSLENYIKKDIDELDEVTTEIREGTTTETESSINAWADALYSIWEPRKMVLLPMHFQPLKNQVANSLRNFSVNLYNHFSLTQVAFNILNHALGLGIDGLTQQKLNDDFATLNELNQQRIETEKYAPVLEKYAPVLTQLLDVKDRLKEKTLTANWAIDNVKTALTLNVNQTPDALFELRDKVAIILRSISVDLWNDFSDINAAITVIKLATGINTSPDVTQEVNKALQDLQALYNKHKHELLCFFCETNKPADSAVFRKTIYKETSRSYLQRRVQFSYKDILIPRCTSCKEIHQDGDNKLWLYIVCLTALGVFIGYAIDEHFIMGGIIGFLAGLILGNILSNSAVKSKKIKTEGDINQYPTVSALLSQGWKFSKPTA